MSASTDMDSLHNAKSAGLLSNTCPTHSSAYSSNVKRGGGYLDGLLLSDSGLSLALPQDSCIILHKLGSLFQLSPKQRYCCSVISLAKEAKAAIKIRVVR